MWHSVTVIDAGKEELSATATTESGSPWFSGHFPDDPILPGIAQLKIVADLITSSREDDVYLTGLSRVKFKKIVRPGERLDIQATRGKIQDQYTFRITSSDKDICSGVMFFAAKDETRRRTSS